MPEYLITSWEWGLGRFRRCDLAEGSMSPGVGFEVPFLVCYVLLVALSTLFWSATCCPASIP